MRKNKWLFLLLVLAMLSSLALSGCASVGEKHNYTMADHDVLTEEIKNSSLDTQDSYRFAVANPEMLANFPCYCGCGAMGHTSNLDCYVAKGGDSEDINFDTHAILCTLCVDITKDVMRYLDEEKSVAQIRQLVDSTYSRFGPSNMEPIN